MGGSLPLCSPVSSTSCIIYRAQHRKKLRAPFQKLNQAEGSLSAGRGQLCDCVGGTPVKPTQSFPITSVLAEPNPLKGGTGLG